jgi:hypothetical protein
MATRKGGTGPRSGRTGATGRKAGKGASIDARTAELEASLNADDTELLADLESVESDSLSDAALTNAAVPLLERVEKKKNDPSAMAERLTQRHLELGKRFLDDDKTTRLDGRLRERVSRFIGRDPGDVRVHTGNRAETAADALGARAFALGNTDIYFGRGQYAPDTAEGLGVLVHELTHVVDNSVGAAFDVGSSQANYNRAEVRPEQNQRSAENAHRSGDADAGKKAAEAPKIDLMKLEEAIVRLVERESRFMADRTGVNGG